METFPSAPSCLYRGEETVQCARVIRLRRMVDPEIVSSYKGCIALLSHCFVLFRCRDMFRIQLNLHSTQPQCRSSIFLAPGCPFRWLSGWPVRWHSCFSVSYFPGSSCWPSLTESGYDQGVFSGIIENENFLHAMGQPNDSLMGIIVSIYNLGCFSGCILNFVTGDLLGRRCSMWFAMGWIIVSCLAPLYYILINWFPRLALPCSVRRIQCHI